MRLRRNAVLGCALLAVTLASCRSTPPASPFVTGRTWNIAHQGGELLWPSNTMTAFRNAAALPVDMLDMDMHVTQDGALVLSHDDTLDRLTDTRGKVTDMTLAQVLRADAGYALSRDGGKTFPFRGQGVRVARLPEVLAAFPQLPMTIEIKAAQPGVAVPFCRALRDAGMTPRVIVASFSDQAMRDFRAACPEVMTSMTERELRPLVLLSKVGLARLAPLPGRAAQVPVRGGGITVVTPAFVRAMHARGVTVQVWTINDSAEMRRLIAMGVDGIFTDRPDLLKTVSVPPRGTPAP